MGNTCRGNLQEQGEIFASAPAQPYAQHKKSKHIIDIDVHKVKEVPLDQRDQFKKQHISEIYLHPEDK